MPGFTMPLTSTSFWLICFDETTCLTSDQISNFMPTCFGTGPGACVSVLGAFFWRPIPQSSICAGSIHMNTSLRASHFATAQRLAALQPLMLSPQPAAGASRSRRGIAGRAILRLRGLEKSHGLL